MIDREGRDRLALALRRLAAGRITNDEFDDEAFARYSHDTDDPALAELATFGWLHYSDLRPYRLRGRHALSPEARKGVARAVLFLKTGQEYVHGDTLTEETVLGKRFAGCVLGVIAIAVAAGAFTHWVVGTFWLGLLGVLASVYVGYRAVYLVMSLLSRVRDSRRSKGTADTHWPFASQENYEAALLNAPFLRGSP